MQDSLDLARLKELLTALSSVGIDEVRIIPMDDGSLIQGADKKRGVAVHYEVDDVFSDETIGLPSVKAFLSRLALFEIDEVVADLRSNGREICKIDMKRGRRSCTYRCNSDLNVPSRIPGDLTIEDPIKFDKDYVNLLICAHSSIAMSGGDADKRVIGMDVCGDELTVEIRGESDDEKFVDRVVVDADSTDGQIRWPAVPFMKALVKSMEYSESGEASFVITEYGLCVFDLGVIDVIVIPDAD